MVVAACCIQKNKLKVRRDGKKPKTEGGQKKNR